MGNSMTTMFFYPKKGKKCQICGESRREHTHDSYKLEEPMSKTTDIIEMSQRISGKSLTDQTKDYLEDKVSNSTQNDEIKQMERAINEGFAESEKFLKGMKTPFDKSSTQNDEIEVDGETYVKWDTQNDWEKRFYDKFPCLMHFRPNKRSYGYSEVGDDVKEFIAKELADARREGFLEGEAHTLSFCDCDKCRNYKRLATLRKEELNGTNN